MKTRLAFLLGLGILAAAPSPALANGRFPESNHIFFSAKDPNEVLLRTTFGLLVSRDRGATWSWVCEKSIGTSGNEDPMYAVTPDGTTIATTFQGIAISSDRLCSWSLATGGVEKTVFVDLSQSVPDPKTVMTFASSYDKQDDAGNILFKSQLFETKDEGKSFTAIGQPFDPSLLGETVDLAPSDPQRIYVSVVKNPGSAPTPQTFLLVSTDHGTSFTPYEVPLVTGEKALFIAGVDPKNADRVYVRTSNATDKPSRLLYSDDGGKSFKTALTSKGALLGFAISADGTKVWAGGPSDGVLMANATDMAFQPKSATQVQCLATGTDGLWACSNEKTGFVAGLSTDDGATFQTKLHFCDIKGALDCPKETPTGSLCPAAWVQQSEQLGCTQPAGDGGADGGDAGTIGPGAQPGGGGGGSGCSCRTTPASPYGAAIAALGAAVAFLRRERRN